MNRLRFEYTVPCPRCKASKGAACKSRLGKWVYPHTERSAVIWDAWRIGYIDGIRAATSDMKNLEVQADFIEQIVRERLGADHG